MSDVELVWGLDCSNTESPTWDELTRQVAFRASTRGEVGGQILSFGVDDDARQVWELPEAAGSLGLCASGRLVVALPKRVALFDRSSGSIVELSDPIALPDGSWLNDGRVGPDGAFWVGSVDPRRPVLFDGGTIEDPVGALYRVAPDGSVEQKAAGYVASNGLAFSPDGATMYHSDRASGYVDAWDFDAETGDISRRRRYLTLSGADGKPDGGATDLDGNYWSAGISAGRVTAFDPSGTEVARIETPCASPTMPCFVEGSVYITSQVGVHRDAAADLSGLPHNIAGLFRTKTDAVGPPVYRFRDA